MRSVASGVSGASPIWRKILMVALEGKPKVEFEKPDNIVTVAVDKISGFRSHDGYEQRDEIFISGTEPGEDPVHVKLKICKGEGKLATPSDIAANNYDEKEYFVFKEEDPVSSDGKNRWQEGVLNWISEQNEPKYNHPTDFCSGVNAAPLNVEFISPRDRESNLEGKMTIKFRVDAVREIKLTELEIDGNKVRSFSGPPYEYEIELDKGVHELRAIAHDAEDNTSDRRITIGVGVAWDSEE